VFHRPPAGAALCRSGGEMTAWIYQMAEDEEWTPEDYRLSVWEGQQVTWRYGKVVSRGGPELGAGDQVIFFFAKSRTRLPGICGWGVVIKVYARKGEMTFRPVFPSDLLKMSPIWDNEIEHVINEVRGPNPRGTMWSVRDDSFQTICRRILEYRGAART